MTSIDRDDRRHGRHTGTAERTTHAPAATEHPDARAEQVRAPEAEADTGKERTRLFDETEVERYRVQWRELQAGFVDEPRATVREAETLVGRMVETLTAQLDQQRQQLRSGADTDDTERLRVVMQRYRTLLDQIGRAHV